MESVPNGFDKETFSLEDARSLAQPTDKFHWMPSDNVYRIKFLRYKIRDMDSGITLADIFHKHLDNDEDEYNDDYVDDNERLIKYKFGPDFLDLRNIGTQLEFSVGDKPVKNLVMIEKHFFKDKQIKDYEFNFKFCIPNTENSWELIYELPELTDSEKQELIESPWEVKSDTFFFVEGKLVIHTRAVYDYSPFDE